jgi:hypothetical protein
MTYRWTLHTPKPTDGLDLLGYLQLIDRFEQAEFVVTQGGDVLNVSPQQRVLFASHMSKYAMDLFILVESGLCPFSVACVKIEQ